ncbi:MAG: HD domain-containing phosphohydrolase [Candidatus Omnitrophota bacterium]|nr:HD domain-containing protein [Candidatus Omnitrophota bacterium]
MRNIGVQVKLSVTFIILVAVSLMVTTFFIYQQAVIQQKENLRARILALAKVSSSMIDGDKFVQIKPVLESQATPAYQEIKMVLGRIRDTEPLIDSVYTMVKSNKDNILIFVVDSGDRQRIIAYAGERYDISLLPEAKLAFRQPTVEKEFSVDKWGTWLSGYSPIYTSSGQVVGIVGVDVSASSIKQLEVALARRFFVVLILGILISLLVAWMVAKGITSPLRVLMSAVKEIEKGNFKYKVNIKSKDELRDLAVAFNNMTDSLSVAQVKLQEYYLNTIKSLARALEAKDAFVKGHSERVTFYAVNIAKRMGLSESDVKLLEDLSILHDIGKIGIPEEVLNKVEVLSEEEWRLIKMHPKIGEDILGHVESLAPGLSIIRDHHERVDGRGYPRGLSKEEITRLASIVTVADSYDAMTSDRPYRKALTKNEAIAALKENKNSQFDSDVVDAFLSYLQE